MISLILLACVEVIRVDPEPMAKPEEVAPVMVDWVAYEAELIVMLEADPNMNTDRRDRLVAALALVDAMQAGDVPEEALVSYLDALLVIEARAEPEQLEEVPVLVPRVSEEDIELGYDTALGPEDVRALLAEGRYVEALRGLDPVKELNPELWQEAVDGYVHVERERAGELYLKALEMPQGEIREAAMDEVVSILERLLEDYPESSYTEDIAENLALVRED